MSSLAVIPQRTQTQNLLGRHPARRSARSRSRSTASPTRPGSSSPNEAGQTLSRAVTQGGGSILVKALQDAGNRQWFTIVERESLRNLLNERQIIREMRERYLGETDGQRRRRCRRCCSPACCSRAGSSAMTPTPSPAAPARPSSASAAQTEYRQDTVTVYLRAVSVRTGEVLTTVTASKTIASQALGASAFKFVAFKELLEAEAGITTNEPDQLALQQAIEKAVYALVMEGVELKLWDFADASAGMAMLWRYQQERDGNFSAEQVQKAMERARRAAPMTSKPRDVPVAGEDKDQVQRRQGLALSATEFGRAAARPDGKAGGWPGARRRNK